MCAESGPQAFPVSEAGILGPPNGRPALVPEPRIVGQGRRRVRVLRLSGRLGPDAVAAVGGLVTQVESWPAGGVACDLSDVDSVTPEAVASLVEIVLDRPPGCPPLVLCAVSGRLAAALAGMDPDRTLAVYPTVADALHAWPSAGQWAELALVGQPDAPARARAFATQVCSAWRLTAVVDELILLVSELVTNAVVHAGVATSITLDRCGALLTIAVADPSPTRPLTRTAGLLAEGGRGLHLAHLLSRTVGSYPRPDGGKTVWATLGLPAAA